MERIIISAGAVLAQVLMILNMGIGKKIQKNLG
jgi:hypothetical protein